MVNGMAGGDHDRLKVIIVGSGLGGLACAIQCRKEGVDVLILEKSSKLDEIGAGIQVPPNAGRILHSFGLEDKLLEAGMVVKKNEWILRWEDGSVIGKRPGGGWAREKFGFGSCTIHRADYQRVLADEAQRLGAEIRFNCDVTQVDCNDISPRVTLANGQTISADIIVGADGLRSVVRHSVLGYIKEPEESNDLAYRITIPSEALKDETNERVRDVLDASANCLWFGGDRHVVLYTIRGGKQVNLVLVCPDDLPHEVSKQPGDLAQMHKLFEDWDPMIKILLSKVDKALKWKIWGMEDLDTWVKGSVALLGDACHPSVPYLAQGAAQAVEDAVVLGRLLGRFSRSGKPKSSLPKLLKLYQDIRKQRAMPIVRAAYSVRDMFHAPDGPKQEERDRLLREHDWWDEERSFPWALADLKTLHGLYGYDAVKSADEGFERSYSGKPKP